MFKQEFILLIYNKDVICIIDKGRDPVCKTSDRIKRRSNTDIFPSHDPYIPRNNALLFNCSTKCNLINFKSMTELTSPKLILLSCYTEVNEKEPYACESIRYNNLKNIDKLLFLSNTIANKTFYSVDCLVYSDGDRVCHKHEDDVKSYADLIDTGTLARPNKTSILAKDEFICEESVLKEVNCDLNPYVPYEGGLRLKQTIKFGDSVLLKTGAYVVKLARSCIGTWCGYSGQAAPTRRQYNYRPPGGKIFRCYYGQKQQVCKEWTDPNRLVYNERGLIEPN